MGPAAVHPDPPTTRRLAPLVEPTGELSVAQVERYARHVLLPGLGLTGQRRLRAARVAVVGAGGLGCPVLQYLAAAGIGALTLIDDDLVESSNLQRQVLHGLDDVGRPKAVSAAESLRATGTETELHVVQRRVTAENAVDLLRGHDLVVDGTDNFPTRYVLDAAAAELGLPVVWAALMRDQAQLTTFWAAPRPAPGTPPVDPVRLTDLFPHAPDPATVPACGDAGIVGALCGLVGSALALEVVRLVTGTGESMLGRLVFVDAAAMRFAELPLAGAGRAGMPAGDAPVHQPPHSPPDESARGAQLREPVAADQSAGRGEPADVPEVTPTALAAALASDARPMVLDVRSAGELAMGVVPGAVHLPLDRILDDPAAARAELRAAGALAEAGASGGLEPGAGEGGPGVVCVCKAGVRAALAADHLRRWGVPGVSVLAGGMLAWREQVDPTLPRY